MTAYLSPGRQKISETATAQKSPPAVSIVWTDPITGHRGYLVIDQLIRGVASGGLRMREGCSYDEVRDLAAAMSIKEALHFNPLDRYIPMGGAKGGIDCDPLSSDARGVLSRFLEFIRPYLENNWATGDDLGTSLELIDEVLDELGIDGCATPVMRLLDDAEVARKRFTDAFSVKVGNIAVSELVGGCGVAEAALTALDRDGSSRRDTRVVIQGFGNMGGATAKFLSEAGLRVAGIADSQGTVTNPQGLAVAEMLANRLPHGIIDRTKLQRTDTLLERDAWIDIETDVLVPAANSYCVDSGNQHRIRAKYIVEAANLPLSRSAEQDLAARGIVTLPDVVANSATNAWWWWVLFGDVGPDAEESFSKARKSLRSLVGDTLDLAEEESISPRHAAQLIANSRLESLTHKLNIEKAFMGTPRVPLRPSGHAERSRP